METKVKPHEWDEMPEGDTFKNTVLYMLEQRRKSEEAAAKGKKYNPNVISSDEMEERYA